MLIVVELNALLTRLRGWVGGVKNCWEESLEKVGDGLLIVLICVVIRL